MPDQNNDTEREWADYMLANYGRGALFVFLSGNPSPAWDLAVNCSEDDVPKLLDSVVCGVLSDPDEFAVEMIMAILSGLHFRYRAAEIPRSLGEAIVESIRRQKTSSGDSS